MKITEKDKISLVKELSKKLLNLSCGRLTEEQSNCIAKSAIDNIDFENSALAHKGLTWYAENIIDMIDFEQLNKNNNMIFKESNLIINVGKKPSNRDKNIRDKLLKKYHGGKIDE